MTKEKNKDKKIKEEEKQCIYRNNCPFQNGVCGPECENYCEED